MSSLHRSAGVLCCCLLVLPVGSPAAAAAPPGLAWLRARINRLAADARIRPARVGVVVRDVRTGRDAVAIRRDEPFNVASNAKLLTASSALVMLGPEYRFRTALYAPDRDHGAVEGPLYLKGFGSPTLTERDLWLLVRDLRDAGVRTVRDGVVIDESFFDDERQPPLYDTRSTDAWYRPPCGALSLEGNVVRIRVRPGRTAGAPARVLLAPRSPYLRLVNLTRTVSGHRRSWVNVSTRGRGGRAVVRVRGRVRIGFRGRAFRRRIDDPGLLTGHALLRLLRRRGVRVRRPRVARGKVPSGTRPIVVHRSPQLGAIVRRMNKRSDNFVAEQLLKVLGAEIHGAPASWDKGLRALRRHMASIGIKVGSYTLRNGSGLYDASALSPHQIARVLRRTYIDFRVSADFVASLPQAGVDGTLAHRLRGTAAERYVRAKTGTLARVVSLSGFAGASGRRGPVAFAILINDLPDGRILAARTVADEIVTAIVTYLER